MMNKEFIISLLSMKTLIVFVILLSGVIAYSLNCMSGRQSPVSGGTPSRQIINE